jgi:hypothetical protein
MNGHGDANSHFFTILLSHLKALACKHQCPELNSHYCFQCLRVYNGTDFRPLADRRDSSGFLSNEVYVVVFGCSFRLRARLMMWT